MLPAVRLLTTDFVLRTGRAGLMAMWIAGLELNEPVIRAAVAEGSALELHHLLHDPLGAGTATTAEALVTRAWKVLGRYVGSVSFRAAVRTLDSLAITVSAQ